MKFTTTFSMLAAVGCQVTAALKTHRVGPLRATTDTYEFGRPAALDPKDRMKAMIQEMNFAHLRLLSDMSVPEMGMSMPDMGMSMPEMGMSMPEMGMSMPSMGMSMPDMGMSMDFGASQDEEDDAGCVPADLTVSPSESVSLTLEVETTAALVDANSLGQSIVSVVSSELSVCVSGIRRLLLTKNIRGLAEQSVVGLQVNDGETGIDASETCVATAQGASSCSVVDLVLDVYAKDESSLEQAKIQVLTTAKTQIEKGLALDTEVIVVRVKADEDESSSSTPRDNTNGANEQEGSSQGGDGFTGTPRTVVITVMSILAVSAVAFVVYKRVSKRRSEEAALVDSVGSSNDLDGSIASGEVDTDLVDVIFDSDSQCIA